MSEAPTIETISFPFHDVADDHVTNTDLAHTTFGASPILYGPHKGKVKLWRVRNLNWDIIETMMVLDQAQVQTLASALQAAMARASSQEVQP
ncbi:hypothetical protein PbB2_00069 [Candidatus Phycosocius bacilliformis]|uniref:Uncharacterized protein n=1 Tax=Candidatus Phycosocius bacilliformis TaxID=1445552 RepID=A0A2P2E5S8_9PROT|nr:hypothetical protein PbB2_00069 [Candidatus Phycosocius bacilliformis]